MTITAVATQAGGVTVDSAATAPRAFTVNVTAGNLIVMTCAKFDTGHTFVAGDCTKTGGTATIGAVSLDKVLAGTNIAAGIWSALVTGSGSLTMSIGSTAGTFFAFGSNEYASDVGWDASRLEDSQTGTGTATTQATANMTSAAKALFIGCFALDTSVTMNSWTNNNGFTDIYKEINGSLHEPGLIINRIVAAGTTTAPSATDVPDGAVLYVGVGATYRETASGGGGPQSPLMGQILL